METNQEDLAQAARRAEQDRFLAVQQRQFDGQVRENTDKRGGWKGMKYERAQFTVVTSSPAYRKGYDHIKWSNDYNEQSPPQGTPPCLVPGSEESVKERVDATDHLLRYRRS